MQKSFVAVLALASVSKRVARTSMALVVAGLGLAGCSGGAALKEEVTPPTTTVKTAPDTSSTASKLYGDDHTGSSSSTTNATTGGSSQTGDKTGFVPDRIYQVDKLQKATCTVAGHVFHLWVMDTDDKRREGMMFLKKESFKDDEGMVFIFSKEGPRRFWMRNTLVDLDVTYNDKSGKILNTYTMKSLDEKTDYSSKGPAMSVIELRDGTLKKLGIQPGMKWQIPSNVVSKDAGNE